jgi:hypothetical protein
MTTPNGSLHTRLARLEFRFGHHDPGVVICLAKGGAPATWTEADPADPTRTHRVCRGSAADGIKPIPAGTRVVVLRKMP